MRNCFGERIAQLEVHPRLDAVKRLEQKKAQLEVHFPRLMSLHGFPMHWIVKTGMAAVDVFAFHSSEFLQWFSFLFSWQPSLYRA